MSPELDVADESDREELTTVLVAANRTIMDLSVVAREKLFAADARSTPRTIAARKEGEIVGLATVSGRVLRLIAVHPHHQRQGIGRLLADEAERIILGEADRVIVGAGPGNYLVPGVAADDSGTIAFFKGRGYRQEHEDGIDLRAALPSSKPELAADYSIRRVRPEERDYLVDTVARNFAFSWGWEIGRAFEGPGDPRCLIAERGGDLAAFAGWELNNRGLGTFGPQGVLSEHRSKGIGGALLLSVLGEMSREGFSEVHIPWVSSVEYYRRYTGARVVARYARLEKVREEN